jgi:adenosylhomocysteine nucleosidase
MRLGVVVGLAAEARLARPLGTVATGGGTAEGALDAAMRLAASGGVDALVSFGLAGGLDPALRPGTALIPAEIRDGAATFTADPALVARFGGPTPGLYLAGTTVAATRADKSALHQATGAVAIDLETGAVIRAAIANHLPWAVLRAVCDPAGRDLPPAALIALDRRGTIALARIALSVLRRPAQLPALLALARDAATARRTLADLAVR